MGALWSLLLVGLLTMLPCAGNARAVTAEAGAVLAPLVGPTGPGRGEANAPDGAATGDTSDRPVHTAPDTSRGAAPDAARRPALRASYGGHGSTGPDPTRHNAGRPAADGSDHALCSAVDGLPHGGNGCSRHPFCAQDSQLPNAPPQPVPAALPRLVTLGALPPSLPVSAPAAHHLAPDLHELQIQRS
ncbi:hypothetical protein OG689_30975 [Kitasatospora sp. NBC_00240]|uniref:hypothetical protein n=1 Tax=Kitasatospora sp. NBC_00240 TaxID=2903567 RepID=UPI00225594DA|nr:hypothetical protein [Kitasatospora sp. NBC_00240]MCX5213642.1 hypothetical protein [Kitasatospora sp. NBC_00240]